MHYRFNVDGDFPLNSLFDNYTAIVKLELRCNRTLCLFKEVFECFGVCIFIQAEFGTIGIDAFVVCNLIDK